ncbi:MAG: hypothetical protein IJU03_09250 [Thermoguttaceae bacterium]|nr:hypothetical protein [Thermoguttaceae bacterium]
MTIKHIIATVAPALFVALFMLCAPFSHSAEPTENIDELISQTFTAPIESKAVDALVNKLARAQDVDSAEKALERALTLDDYPLASVERLAACYYHLRLRAAARDGSAAAYDAYAQLVLDDMRRSDVCANVSIQACRNLSFYDAERAKKLFLELVAEFASSESDARRAAVRPILQTMGLAPAAASDADVDLTEFRERIGSDPDDSSVRKIDSNEIARSFAKLSALAVANTRAYDFVLPYGAANYVPSASSRRECLETLATYADALNASDMASAQVVTQYFDSSIDIGSLSYKISSETDPEVIKNFIDDMRRRARRDIYDNYVAPCYDAYFKALGLEASRDGSDAAFDRFVDQCASAIAADPNGASRIAARFVDELRRADKRLAERLIADLRASDVAEARGIAEMIEGSFRFNSDDLIGRSAVLEGVCQDGAQITLDDYRGKRVLLVMSFYAYQAATPTWLEKFYDKYHDLGVEIVQYVSDLDDNYLVQPNTYLTTRDIKLISRKRTAANPELGGREYADMGAYYGVGRSDPMKTLLIDPDGKIVAKWNGNQFNGVEEELKKLYPDIE